MVVRILLTCRLDQTNPHDFVSCIANVPGIDLFVLTDSPTYPEVPELERDHIFHFHPTWPVVLSRFSPHDKSKLQNIVDTIDPDVLLSLGVGHLSFLSTTIDFNPAVFLPQGGKVNSATRERCKEFDYGMRWIMYRPMMWELLRHVDEVWAGEPSREMLMDLGLKSHKSFINFDWGVVNVNKFYPKDNPISFTNNTDKIVIGTFRRARDRTLIPSYETFLDGVAELKDRRDDFTVVIGGFYEDSTGSEVENFIDNKVCEHGLQDVVKKVGMIPKDDMPQHYSGLDIYVNISPANGMGGIGTASKEAMACGCLFTTFNNPSAEYVINDGENGLLFEHGESEELASKLEKVMSKPNKMCELKENARDTSVEMFSCDTISTRVRERCYDLIEPR